MIYQYQDYRHNTATLYRALIRRFGHDRVAMADAADIKAGILDGAEALVMPGGASRFFAEKLGEEGEGIVRRYVRDGGCYVGICAGAYYAAKSIGWRTGETGEIIAKSALGFFPGAATGPIPALSVTQDRDTIPLGLAAVTRGPHVMPCLYWGGPLFEDAPGVEVLARYADLPGQPAALLRGRYGMGRYVLSSIHPEYDAAALARIAHGDQSFFKPMLAGLAESTEPLWDAIAATIEE